MDCCLRRFPYRTDSGFSIQHRGGGSRQDHLRAAHQSLRRSWREGRARLPDDARDRASESFEKALYAIEANFPPGKLPGQPEFTNTYFNMSQGEGDMRGPWNQGEQWDFVDDRAKQAAVDGGDGSASVKLSRADVAIANKVAARTMSDPASDPTTGAELGQGVVSS